MTWNSTLKRKSRMKPSSKPMRRSNGLEASGILKRKRSLERRVRRWTAAEERERAAARNAYRDYEGVLHCADCGRSGPDGFFHLHHSVHRARGGKHGRANLIPLCPTCHARRHGERIAS